MKSNLCYILTKWLNNYVDYQNLFLCLIAYSEIADELKQNVFGIFITDEIRHLIRNAKPSIYMHVLDIYIKANLRIVGNLLSLNIVNTLLSKNIQELFGKSTFKLKN